MLNQKIFIKNFIKLIFFKLQCNLALQLDSDFSKSGADPAERFAKYFWHVAGFYIIEDTVFKTTTNFLLPETVNLKISFNQLCY